jgi:hypothetical protein
MGTNRFLLGAIGRHALFGLDQKSYVERLRAAYEADPEGRSDISP